MTAAALPIPDDDAYVSIPVTTSTTGPFTIPFPLPLGWQGALHCSVDGEELASGAFAFSPDVTVTGGYISGTVLLVDAVEDCTVELWRDIPITRSEDYGQGPLDFDAFNVADAMRAMQLQDARLRIKKSELWTGGVSAVPVSPAMTPVVQAATLDAAMELLDQGDFTATGSTTARNLADRFADVGNVKDFGAVGDTTTNDTAAFAACLAVYSNVYVPPGTYRIEGLTIPDGKRLFGAGRSATRLRANASTSYVVRVGQHSILEYLEVNGNNLATSGVEVNTKDFAQIRFVNAQYCTRGFYFTSADVVTMLNTASDNNDYGIYTDERFINCAVIRHVSNGDDYGFYNTYTTQQAQGISFTSCMFISNATAGYYFVKDAFSLSLTDCIVDLCGGNAIYLGAAAQGTAVDLAIQRGFFFSASPALRIFPCWQHVSIHGTTLAGSQTTSVVLISATTTTRTEHISFVDCRIGSTNSSGKGIDADSVYGLDVMGCDFTASGSTTDIAIGATYTSFANPLPTIQNNIFRKGGDPITGSAVVLDNIGYTTRENLPVQEVAFGGTGFALAQGADIASATTTDIGAATGPYIHITGTTTITGLGTVAAGARRTVKFTGALTLTHNGTSLILPGSANITTAANDTAEFVSLGSGNWLCLRYTLASTAPTLIVSGTYTPTLTGVANVAASTAYVCQYIRVGTVVTVSGKVDIDPTAGATLTQLGISLPVASNFGAPQNCAGSIVSEVGSNGNGSISADPTNDRADVSFICGTNANQAFFFQFTYRVQ